MLSLTGYTIHATLSETATTAVYRATRHHDHQPVILKTTPEPVTPFEIWARQNRAFELHQRCASPHVTAAYHHEKQGQRWLLVLEDFGGEPLANLLANGPLPLSTFFPIALGLVQGLAAIHERRIIHKDINPRNILIHPTTHHVKITDFDIASLLPQEAAHLLIPDLLEGTLAYISPEQTGRMNRPLDFRTDFYSLGATFYHMLTGQLPFPTADLMELIHSHLARLPQPPHTLNPAIPPQLGAIILKLMAKTAEARYQSSAGLHHDLAQCAHAWQTTADIPPFPLGQRDISTQFHIPPKLYGRAPETHQLLAAFQRASTGPAELLLVTGHSGIGKSALIKEIHKPIVAQRGQFATGKFDQLQRQTPYASLLPALRDLLRQRLAHPPAQLAGWSQHLAEALAGNGRLFLPLLPELGRLLGHNHPPIAELPPAEAQKRFTHHFVRLIRALATAEHPLALFLDDLQWADNASLHLLEQLFTTDGQTHHLLLIGAYRDNHVDAGHPLALTLARLHEAHTPLTRLHLLPLDLDDTTSLLADTLHHPPAKIFPLAELCQHKTGGNPFFLGQFLHTLHQDGLIQFDPTHQQWQWSLEAIRQRDITANVVELMAGKLQQLPPTTQELVQTAACLGHQFNLATLSQVWQGSPSAVAHHLWPALQAGHLLPLSEGYRLLDGLPTGQDPTATVAIPAATATSIRYKFAHDRIQQAAYSLIPPATQAALHKQLGQLLWAEWVGQERHPEVENNSEPLFAIVNQFNLALPLLETAAEQALVSQLNLQAGEHALASAAYEPAATYLQTSYNLLPPHPWQTNPDMALRVHRQLATAAYLNGRYTHVDQLATATAAHITAPLGRLPLVELQILATIAQHQPQQAIAHALPLLAELGVELPTRPTPAQQMACFQQLADLLHTHPLPTLAQRPHLTDPHQQAISRLLALITAPVAFYAPPLTPLVAYELASRGILYGHTPFSAYGYALLGSLLIGTTGDVALGMGLGEVALQVVGQFDNQLAQGRTAWMVTHYIRHWAEPMATTLPHLQQAYEVAVAAGDMEYAAYAAFAYLLHSLYAGRPLPALAEEMAAYGSAIGRFRHETAARWLAIYQELVHHLLTDEAEPPPPTAEDPSLTQSSVGSVRFHHHAAQLIRAYLLGDEALALHTAEQGGRDVAKMVAHPAGPIFCLFDALTRMAQWAKLDETQQAVVGRHRKALAGWAKPAGAVQYRVGHLLLEAEWAQLAGDKLAALEGYDAALALARTADVGWLEAITAECAARFYEAWGKEKIAAVYWRDAYEAYRYWGAAAKVAQMRHQRPWLVQERRGERGSSSSIKTTITNATNKEEVFSTLDIVAATRAAQTIASEVVLPTLLEKVMRLMLESAAAQVGYLLLPQEDGTWVIEVAGREGGAHIAVEMAPLDGQRLPLSIIHYVSHAQEELVLAQATAVPEFSADPYIQAQQVQSVLCLPLLNRGTLSGLLYLENNLMPNAFTADHLAMLYVLGAQAAVSLDNARLYERLTAVNQQLEQYSQNLADIVDERTAELQSTVAELNAFAHTVAHDLKSPLTGMIGFSEMVQEELTEEGLTDMATLLQRVIDGGHRMRRIIDGLLTLAMTRDGHVEVAPLAMYPLVLEVHERFVYLIEEKGAQFEMAREWPTAVGYAPWVEEVWANYVSNALKYGGREGFPPHIQLGATTQPDGLIRFWVRDNGMGMTAEQMAKIFTPFTRLNQLNNDSHGLGLSIVERIVTKLGGTVGVESEVGVGTLFYFTLPPA